MIRPCELTKWRFDPLIGMHKLFCFILRVRNFCYAAVRVIFILRGMVSRIRCLHAVSIQVILIILCDCADRAAIDIRSAILPYAGQIRTVKVHPFRARDPRRVGIAIVRGEELRF